MFTKIKKVGSLLGKKTMLFAALACGFLCSTFTYAQDQVVTVDFPVDTTTLHTGMLDKISPIVANGIGIFLGFAALMAGVYVLVRLIGKR